MVIRVTSCLRAHPYVAWTMLTTAEDPTVAFSRFAERTIRAEEFGTVILESVPFRTEDVIDAPFPMAEPPADPLARLEEKLDTALRTIAAMQQRIESLDATLMRVLMR